MDTQTRVGYGATALFTLAGIAAPIATWWVSAPIMIACAFVAGWGFWPVVQRQLSGKAEQEIPIWRAVAYVRGAIGDDDDKKCYPRTLEALRQAALDRTVLIRGRHEIDTGSDTRTTFSTVRSDIPAEYWKISTIGALATDKDTQSDIHTNPETVYSWGPKGIYEKNRYADLSVIEKQIKKRWPAK